MKERHCDVLVVGGGHAGSANVSRVRGAEGMVIALRVEVTGLSKTYPGGVEAVKPLDLTLFHSVWRWFSIRT